MKMVYPKMKVCLIHLMDEKRNYYLKICLVDAMKMVYPKMTVYLTKICLVDAKSLNFFLVYLVYWVYLIRIASVFFQNH